MTCNFCLKRIEFQRCTIVVFAIVTRLMSICTASDLIIQLSKSPKSGYQMAGTSLRPNLDVGSDTTERSVDLNLDVGRKRGETRVPTIQPIE